MFELLNMYCTTEIKNHFDLNILNANFIRYYDFLKTLEM